jgi:hypothetical protein
MKTFHVDEPREIGKKRIKVSRNDLIRVKDELTELVIKKKLRELIRKEIKASK